MDMAVCLSLWQKEDLEKKKKPLDRPQCLRPQLRLVNTDKPVGKWAEVQEKEKDDHQGVKPLRSDIQASAWQRIGRIKSVAYQSLRLNRKSSLKDRS
jgi:hypothetical protein